MNKNIKFAIYFLLGIVLFYLMFNGNGVEGFGPQVNFIYVRVNTGDFERFVILDATDDADDIPTPTASSEPEPTGLQGELNNILTGGTYTYYKSESGDFFIQKVVAASCTGGSNCSGISTSASCTAATCTFTPSSGDGSNASCTGSTACSDIDAPNASNCGSCTFNAESTEYYLVRMNGETVTSIHKIRSDLSSLNVNSAADPIGTDQPNPLQIYTVTDASGSYTSASGTTVTIDTFPRCSRPESTTGYTPVETSLKIADFNVSGTCASGYTGTTVLASACEADNNPYRLTGCTIETHDFTCNNGSAASGSSTTPTESCTACDDGYSLDSNRCVPNGSCSDFTATCPEGKEVNEDKSCSGTCTADECCEEESNLVMICLVVCLLIFCVILIGAGAYLTIGKKSSGPPIQSAPVGY